MERKFGQKLLRKVLLELKNGLLLVEGRNDLLALGKIGILGNVLLAIGRNEQIIQKTLSKLEPNQKLILLFDYDPEGERKTAFFRELFLNEGALADIEIRKKVKMLFGITTIEELPYAYGKVTDDLE